MVRLVEELWASFGYDTPEDHAKVIYNLIAKELIEKFIEFLSEFNDNHFLKYYEIDEEIEKYKKSLQNNESKEENDSIH